MNEWDEKSVFLSALELPEGEREAYLDTACPDDAAKERIQTLLRHHQEASDEFIRFTRSHHVDDRRTPVQIDEFKILHRLGEGGMGVVYLAKDTVLGREVAIKVLAHHLVASELAIGRFRQEAKAAARLSHPGIVPIYRYGEEGGAHYIAMEYVQGATLAEHLSNLRGPRLGATDATDAATPTADSIRSVVEPAPAAVPGGSEYLHDCARLVAAVADALEHAHRHGVIHRDVKPSNIIVDSAGRPRLTDFGIARVSTEEPLTETGHITGTYYYMSPEQAAATHTKVDHRSDVFSLGVVLYEALTLRRPFNGKTPQQIVHALQTQEPRKIRSLNQAVSRDLETICHKAMEKRPADRYQTAAHLAADLQCYLRGAPILALPPGLGRKARQFLYTRRHVMTAAAALIAGTIVGVYSYRHFTDDRPRLIADGLPRGAEVFAREIDLRTGLAGELQRLGLASSGSHRMLPGYYRLIARLSATKYCEMTRYLDANQDVHLFAPIRTLDDVTTDMILISSGAETFSHGSSAPQEYVNRVERLGAFWIDRTEVSNAQYLKFLQAQSNPPQTPALWGGSTPPPGWADLPIVGVTYYEAQAYAEWSGKRLPTSHEWGRAARGSRGWRFPWGDDSEGLQEKANVFRDTNLLNAWKPPSDDERQRDYYGRYVLPVADEKGHDDVGPHRLLHTLGNVAEWTESIRYTSAIPLIGRRIIRGDTWSRNTDEKGMLSLSGVRMHQDVTSRAIGLGFRCAKSAES